MSRFVKRMSHVALRVPDLDASVAWATTIMGLREVQARAGPPTSRTATTTTRSS